MRNSPAGVGVTQSATAAVTAVACRTELENIAAPVGGSSVSLDCRDGVLAVHYCISCGDNRSHWHLLTQRAQQSHSFEFQLGRDHERSEKMPRRCGQDARLVVQPDHDVLILRAPRGLSHEQESVARRPPPRQLRSIKCLQHVSPAEFREALPHFVVNNFESVFDGSAGDDGRTRRLGCQWQSSLYRIKTSSCFISQRCRMRPSILYLLGDPARRAWRGYYRHLCDLLQNSAGAYCTALYGRLCF